MSSCVAKVVTADVPSRAAAPPRGGRPGRHRRLPDRTGLVAGWALQDPVLIFLGTSSQSRGERISHLAPCSGLLQRGDCLRLIDRASCSALRVSVRNCRPTPIPRPRPIDIDALTARGLHLVTALAHCWGTDQHPDGKTIWVHLVECEQDTETGLVTNASDPSNWPANGRPISPGPSPSTYLPGR